MTERVSLGKLQGVPVDFQEGDRHHRPYIADFNDSFANVKLILPPNSSIYVARAYQGKRVSSLFVPNRPLASSIADTQMRFVPWSPPGQ